MNYVILPDTCDYIPYIIREISDKEHTLILTVSEFIQRGIKQNATDKIYLPSDTTFPLIKESLHPGTRRLIELCRDKFAFRNKLSVMFSSFFYKKASLEEISTVKLDFNRQEKYVIKPTIGFMGGATRVIHKNTNISTLTNELQEEIKKYAVNYPNIFSTDFIIEDYIGDGKEIAVDMYYDAAGMPTILSIYLHPPAANRYYLQLLYYFSKKVFSDYYPVTLDFFNRFNKDGNLKSFPLHAEFKFSNQGELVPIEINSARFGGMGLSDLMLRSFNINILELYLSDLKLDWKNLWSDKGENEESGFCWVLAYNPENCDITVQKPDYSKLFNMLPKDCEVLNFTKLDYKKFPAFGLLYLKTKNKHDIVSIQSFEFDECFS